MFHSMRFALLPMPIYSSTSWGSLLIISHNLSVWIIKLYLHSFTQTRALSLSPTLSHRLFSLSHRSLDEFGDEEMRNVFVALSRHDVTPQVSVRVALLVVVVVEIKRSTNNIGFSHSHVSLYLSLYLSISLSISLQLGVQHSAFLAPLSQVIVDISSSFGFKSVISPSLSSNTLS